MYVYKLIGVNLIKFYKHHLKSIKYKYTDMLVRNET
jgi:hypothetical protein